MIGWVLLWVTLALAWIVLSLWPGLVIAACNAVMVRVRRWR